MKSCTNCAGTGLIGGNPDAPHLHVGALHTCPVCTGTGSVSENVEATSAPTDDQDATALPPETPAEAPVDNDVEASKPRGGIFKRLLG